MIEFNAANADYRNLNEWLRGVSEDARVTNICGQRFIGAGFSQGNITVEGTPGNALGAYLNGAVITVHGNAQDAVGDTMNDGKIVIRGNIGDAAGYAMRGGSIYIKGNAGYRAGIHMKEYKEKRPVIVVGGKCGSFLGEYQAGGIILVLGLTEEKTGGETRKIVSNFPCTGMHGGKVFLRCPVGEIEFPKGVSATAAGPEDMESIRPYLQEFCRQFGTDEATLLNAPYTKVVPDSKNPYKQMYVAN